MRNSRLPLAVTAAAIVFFSGLAFPAGVAVDSVKARLDARKINHEVDKDGDYKITFNYSKEKRSQLVFVSGKTETLGKLVIREIFAPAARVGTDGVDGDRALDLLKKSRMRKMGSWEIEGDLLVFVIKFPDNVDAETLEDLLNTASEIADDTELELTGKDDL